MTAVLLAAWRRVREPRVIALCYFVAYLLLAGGGASALTNPPTSIEGAVGDTAMTTLALLLAGGGALGVVAVLPGWYWLERLAVIAVALASGIYAAVITTLHVTQPGNRLLQLSLVIFVGILQAVRWHRIRERPYDPDRPPPTRSHAH